MPNITMYLPEDSVAPFWEWLNKKFPLCRECQERYPKGTHKHEKGGKKTW